MRQCRIERAFLNAKHVGQSFDMRADAVAVQRPAAFEDREDEQWQRALEGITGRHA
jgi:hypothetical protein